MNTKVPYGLSKQQWAAITRGMEGRPGTINDYRKVVDRLHAFRDHTYSILTMTADDAAVFKAVSADGVIIGFCVAEIQEDGADPFGMVCDVLVDEARRCGGVGTALLEAALGWFKEKGIVDVYLESGLNNHAAHEYFMRRGFVKVSEIYKLA
jgi:ribosomal protein S18 acetylase RimI-like enzyme